MNSVKTKNYYNPYSNLPDIDYASTVFDNDEQAASEKYYNDVKAAQEYDAAIHLMLDERDYNSPESQVHRLRQAGINPDLQNIESGDAGNMPNVTSPVAPVNDGSTQSQAILGMSQAFIQAIPQAVSIVQGIRSSNQQLDMNELDLIDKADNVARKEIGRQFTLSDLNDKHSYPQAFLGHYSKRTQKHIQNAIDMYVRDPGNMDIAKGFVYDNKSKGQQFRKGYLDIISQAGFDLDDDTFVGVLTEYNNIVRSAMKNKSNYESNYYGSLDGTEQAKAENAQHVKQGLDAENTAMSKLMSRANELLNSDKAGDKAKGLLLYVITSLVGSTSFSLGTHSKTGNKSISFGVN